MLNVVKQIKIKGSFLPPSRKALVPLILIANIYGVFFPNRVSCLLFNMQVWIFTPPIRFEAWCLGAEEIHLMSAH